jgi:hypothetical protein
MTSSHESRRDAIAQTIYEHANAGAFVPMWGDLPENRRERWRRAAVAADRVFMTELVRPARPAHVIAMRHDREAIEPDGLRDRLRQRRAQERERRTG